MSRLASIRAATAGVIELGAGHVTAARFTSRRGVEELSQLAFRELPVSEGEGEGTAGATQDALNAVVAELGMRGPVTLVLPGHLALTKIVSVPRVAEPQRAKLIAFEARQHIPFDLADVCWAQVTLGDVGPAQEVLLVAAKRDAVQHLVRRVQAAGIDVAAIIPAGVALLAGDHPAESESDLIVSIGARTTQLIFRSGPRLSFRSLPWAGGNVTRAIAEALQQPSGDAERLKCDGVAGSTSRLAETPADRAVRTAVESFTTRLQQEINRSVVTQVHQSGLLPPQRIWLTGGGTRLPELASQLETFWPGAVAPWDALSGCRVGESARGPLAELGEMRLADLMGAWRWARNGAVAIDLTPPELRTARETRRRRPRWWTAAALVGFTTFLPGWHYQQLAAARNEEVRGLRLRAVPVQAIRDQNEKHLATLEQWNRKIRALEAGVVARSAWSGLLMDLQTSLATVGDVWLERLQVVPTSTTAAQVVTAAPLKLRLSGRLLDRKNPLSRVSQSSYERVSELLNLFRQSPRIVEVEGERFDAGDPGILRFDFTLVLHPQAGL